MTTYEELITAIREFFETDDLQDLQGYNDEAARHVFRVFRGRSLTRPQVHLILHAYLAGRYGGESDEAYAQEDRSTCAG